MSVLKPVSFRKGRGHAPRLSEPYVPGTRHKRFWRQEELDILRRHYPEGGAYACLARLPPHRTLQAVQSMARNLGIMAPTASKRSRVPVPDGIDQQIREEWPKLAPGKRGERAALAVRLGVPEWWLSKRVKVLGLTIPGKRQPPWTRAEDQLLRTVPLYSPDMCARIFREHGYSRTATAITVRARRIGLSRRASHTTLSASAAARILGVNHKTIGSWCIAGDIRASRLGSRLGTRRLPQQGGDTWSIAPEDFRRFVIDNLERIDFRKVDKFAIVDLLMNTPDQSTREKAPTDAGP